MEEWRCDECGRKLAECDIIEGKAETKCPRCGALNEYSIERSEPRDGRMRNT